MDRLLAIVPRDAHIDWPLIERTVMAPFVADLTATPQTATYHGEGNVWAHTILVCEELVKMDAFWNLPERARQEVFLATLFHDIGKPSVTTEEPDGHFRAQGHAKRGAHQVRELLWKEYGMAGDPDRRTFRETVCSLVQHHAMPLHIADSPYEESRFRAVAAEAELSGDYTWELQCLVTEADVRGRIADDVPQLLNTLEYCRLRAQDLGCFTGPYPFPDAYTRFRYLDGYPVSPDYPLFNETWGEVTVLCGLPGTGKDYYIEHHLPGLPVVSLDGIRQERGILPSDSNQGPVVQEAMDRAKAFLRARQSFVWNATSLTRMIRGKILALCRDYKASTRIVFLETNWDEELRRNASRTDVVPLDVIERMLSRLEVPYPQEAEVVEWICT